MSQSRRQQFVHAYAAAYGGIPAPNDCANDSLEVDKEARAYSTGPVCRPQRKVYYPSSGIQGLVFHLDDPPIRDQRSNSSRRSCPQQWH